MTPENPMPLTLQEHQELGREIRAADARLRELCSMMVGIYGQQNAASDSFREVAAAMERLRTELQAQAARDLPGLPMDGIYV